MDISKELSKALEAAEKYVLDGESSEKIYGAQLEEPHLAPWPTEPCKIVFLDLDGVLNSELSIKKLGTRFRFAETNVSALNEILQQTQARIVITSTWRSGYSLPEIASFLERDGVLAKRVAGKTQILNQPRGLEIDAWLRSVPYAVASYVILDDNNDMAMHSNRLVQTAPLMGLTFTQAQRAIELLSVPWT
ncbi:MAG TPA: HAD domain-containing protein [Mariprofundaceae bacterium]|nr:HAD domain-containing protein [Mariprofundaceae bacterium]